MIDLQQDTLDWLEFRKSRIGASDCPIIMGVSPWKTSYELWLEKLGLSMCYMNEAMARGKKYEPTARFEFEIEHSIKVNPKVLIHPEYEWMIASLDGIDITGKKIVEIKCPGKDDHQQALSGKIPDKYYPQLQHQIEVAGVDQAYYFSWTPSDFVTLTVDRNDAYIKKLIEREQEFYECLQQLTPPPLGDKDYIRRNDDLWQEVSERWRIAKEQLKSLESSERELRETLIHLAGEKNCIGNGVKVLRTARRGSVDYSQIPELIGIDLEKYRKETSTIWRITDV